jgi:hypothetical protein
MLHNTIYNVLVYFNIYFYNAYIFSKNKYLKLLFLHIIKSYIYIYKYKKINHRFQYKKIRI